MPKKKSDRVTFTFDVHGSLENITEDVRLNKFESRRCEMNDKVTVYGYRQDYRKALSLLSQLSEEMIESDRPDPRCRLCWAHIGNNMSHEFGCTMAEVDEILNTLEKELRG